VRAKGGGKIEFEPSSKDRAAEEKKMGAIRTRWREEKKNG